jgi:hypothetical protein
VSSRGILNCCDNHNLKPESGSCKISIDFSKIKQGSSLYLCSHAIKEYSSEILRQIPHKIILVTGDSVLTCPNDLFYSTKKFYDFINSEKIIHWFAQNCIGKHSKLSQIPLGLDYHTLEKSNHSWGLKQSSLDQENELIEIKNEIRLRKPLCYGNFHFRHIDSKFGYDRRDALSDIKKELIYYEPLPCERKLSWITQSNYAFIISPLGNGLDCHRTWEALALGQIPIVKRSELDPLYDELPVLIVSDWNDITETLLSETLVAFNSKTFNYEKLTMSYWNTLINSYKTN